MAAIKQQDGFNTEGNVNWMKVYAYKPEFGGSEMLSNVVHRRSDAATFKNCCKIESKSWDFFATTVRRRFT